MLGFDSSNSGTGLTLHARLMVHTLGTEAGEYVGIRATPPPKAECALLDPGSATHQISMKRMLVAVSGPVVTHSIGAPTSCWMDLR